MTAMPISSLQAAYNASVSPQITVDAIGGALLIRDNVIPLSPFFGLQNNSGVNVFAASETGLDIGPAGRRLFNPNWETAGTGRIGCEIWPDDFSIITATGAQGSAFYTDAGRTITLNIPGGGAIFAGLDVTVVDPTVEVTITEQTVTVTVVDPTVEVTIEE